MGYDCSITNRKGCNYCMRRKDIDCHKFAIVIDDEDKTLTVSYDNSEISGHDEEDFSINYCPICGRKLTSKQ